MWLNSPPSSPPRPPSPHLAGSSLPARYIGDAWLATGHGGDLQPAGLQQVQGRAADSVTTAEGQEVI